MYFSNLSMSIYYHGQVISLQGLQHIDELSFMSLKSFHKYSIHHPTCTMVVQFLIVASPESANAQLDIPSSLTTLLNDF